MDAPAKLLSISQERDVINENIIRTSKFNLVQLKAVKFCACDRLVILS